MRFTKLSLTAVAALSLLGTYTNADIIVSNAEPTDGVILDAIFGNARQNGIINSEAAQGSRGSGFTLASTPGVSQFDISSVTVDGRGTTAANTEITVSIFSGSAYNTTFAAPGGTIVDSSDFVAATGVTLISEETFTVGTGGLMFATNDFVTFEFDSDIRVNADSDLTVLFSTSGGAFNNFDGNNNANQDPPIGNSRFLFATGTTSLSTPTGSSRDFRFAIGGAAVSAIPEPSSLALLGCGALGLVSRRRRR